jgi:transcriptional regulator with PAS, ATPase and Fis domain
MAKLNWEHEISMAVTICDTTGIIQYMNNKSIATFSNDGGENLIGKNLFDCHSTSSQNKILDLLKNRKTNIYTIQKNGKKKMIIQTPWIEDSETKGMVELSIELPEEIPHYNRD